LDVVAGRWRAHKVEELIRKTAEADGRGVMISLPQDPGQAGKGQAASLIKLLAGFRAVATRESGDKETRAVMCAAQWQAGNIDVVRASWNEAFLTELDAFPKKGVHDDRVDALAGAFNLCIQGSSFMANFVK
jgi:predicted phage terminase large subunit-like protein